ncbi:MAG: helix-turn-helix transcriptional regulator [Lachnospiraceae bacterium]|nr:helix-turn-helix transcriptional regulator [Lachnospiraceae bacterium]
MGKHRKTRKFRAERIEKWRNANVIGRNITRLREKNHLTIEDMADETGMCPSLIWYWENGTHVPSTYDTLYLAEYFGVSIEKLLKLKK